MRSQLFPATSRNTTNRPYGSYARFGHELHAGRPQVLESVVEVLDVEEEADSSTGLIADAFTLSVAVGSCEKQPGCCAGWPNDDPAFGATVVRERWLVLDEFEAEHVDEEGDRLLVVGDHDRRQPEVRHRSSLPRHC